MNKSIGFQRRHPDLNAEQFARRWLVGHKPLANRAHGFLRYVCTLIVDRLGDVEDYDGIGQMWFESREAVRDRLYLHPDSLRVIRADTATFLGQGLNFGVLPEILKGPHELARGPSPDVDADGFTLPTPGRKAYATLTRPAGEESEAFVARGRAAAGRLAETFPGLTALTWNVIPPSRRDVYGFDAVFEAHFDDAAPRDLLPALRSAFTEAVEGHLGRNGWYQVVERVQWGEGDPRPRRDATTRHKLASLVRRRAGQSLEDFFAGWVVGHKPLAIRHHGFRRYVCSFIEGRAGAAGDWDGLMEMWFDSEEAATGRLHLYGAESRQAVRSDAAGFIGGSLRFSLRPRDLKGTPELERGPGPVDASGRTRPTPARKLFGTLARPAGEARAAFVERGLAAARALAAGFPGLVALTWNGVAEENLPVWNLSPEQPEPPPPFDAVLEAWLDGSAPPDPLAALPAAFAARLENRLGESGWYLAREYVQASIAAEGAPLV